MKKSILNNVVRIANEKLKKHPEFNNFPHYSFIIQNNRIIEWATNVKHEPPIYFGYHRLDDSGYVPKFHSEIFAYKKARGLLNNKAFSIINVRLNKSKQLRLSKPCKSCFELMCCLGCRDFYFSSEIGFMRLSRHENSS